jgi:hypothetical protein
MSYLWLPTLAVLAGLVTPCHAAEGASAGSSGLSGWWRVDAFSSTRTLDDRDGAASAELGLKYSRDLGAEDRLRFEGSLVRDLRDHQSRGRLTDAYWQRRGDKIDWRIGQQKVTWGKADGINPTDFFTPHDYTTLQPFEEDQRRSIPALRADIAASEGHSLSVVLSPDFTAERQPMPRDLSIIERQPNGLHRPQLGLRWSSTSETLDWSVSAFRGFLNAPLLDAEGGQFFHQYAKLSAVGADMARNFGRWGMRAEAAWLQPKTEPGTQGIRPFAHLVAGVDHGEDDWNINVQALLRYTPDFDQQTTADPLEAAAAQQNAINFGQLKRRQFGAMSRIAANWFNQTLQGEVLVIHYADPGNTLLRPLLTYALSDTRKLTLGAELYDGPAASFFGQLKRNQTVFFEYRDFF